MDIDREIGRRLGYHAVLYPRNNFILLCSDNDFNRMMGLKERKGLIVLTSEDRYDQNMDYKICGGMFTNGYRNLILEIPPNGRQSFVNVLKNVMEEYQDLTQGDSIEFSMLFVEEETLAVAWIKWFDVYQRWRNG